MKWLKTIPYPLLIGAGAFLALAPFEPEPHLVQKTRMLFEGNLSAWIDVFDLLWHGSPLILLMIKVTLDVQDKADT